MLADCLNCFLWRWYLLESFDTLFELNSLPSAATVTSNNCATTMCNFNERSQGFELQSIGREQLSVHMHICAFVWPMRQQNHQKTTNTQKIPSDGNRSTIIFCKFVYYLCASQQNHSFSRVAAIAAKVCNAWFWLFWRQYNIHEFPRLSRPKMLLWAGGGKGC